MPRYCLALDLINDDKLNPAVQQWEQLMGKYQQAIPGCKPTEKWMLMDKIFSLADP